MNLSKVKWIALKSHADERGVLTSIEGEGDIPFKIERIFYMHRIVTSFERGGHAHRDTEQVIIPFSGEFKLDLSDGVATETFKMRDATVGLYVPKMIWARLYDFSEGTICMVLASTHYDITKSLRTWEEYKVARDC
jgi:hypothetical protein